MSKAWPPRIFCNFSVYFQSYDRKTERQKDRKAERQKGRKTERQKDRKTERQDRQKDKIDRQSNTCAD